MHATATISLSYARENLTYIQRLLPQDTRLFCVVKANAYGHGALPLARLFSSLAPVSFAVAHLEEGIALREGGITSPILILGDVGQGEITTAFSYHLTPSIHHILQAKDIHRIAVKKGISIPYHLKIDSGMGRLGFVYTSHNFKSELEELFSFSHLYLTGVYTHYATADMGIAGSEFVALQQNRFQNVISLIKKRVANSFITHAGNSSILLDHPHHLCGGARVGILLYGILPSCHIQNRPALSPVMTLSAPVVHLKEVEPGTPIGYGGTYVTKEKRLIATLPIGYADGLHRTFIDKGVGVTIHGTFCPLVGRISMDSCTVDVTEARNTILGDTAVFWGKGGKQIEEVAAQFGTIPYELVACLGGRVKRIYTP